MAASGKRRFVQAELQWLIENPTTCRTAGLTGYRKQEGPGDLFSIYVHFANSEALTSTWRNAKIYALVSEMEGRLPVVGEVLVITAGAKPVAEARIMSVGNEEV